MSLWSRFRWAVTRGSRPSAVRREIEEDIRLHIEMDAERLGREEGLSVADARALARERFGDQDTIREAVMREMPGFLVRIGWDRAAAGLFQGARSSIRQPAAAGLVIVTLGAAVTLAATSVALAVAALTGDGGVDDPHRVISMHAVYPSLPEGMRAQPVSPLMFEAVREMEDVEEASAFKSATFNVTERGRPRRVDGLRVTPGLMKVAGVAPALGQDLGSDPTAPRVLLAWATWRDLFGSDPDVVGSSLVLNGRSHAVVGVMPEGFVFPRGEDVPASFSFARRPALWVPYDLPERGPSDLATMLRLRPGVSVDVFRQRLGVVEAQLEARFGSDLFDLNAVPLRSQAAGSVRPAITFLVLATGLVVLVVLANLAGIGVVRSEARGGELAVRTALGATVSDRLSVLLGESLVVAVAALLLGVAGADLVLSVLRRTAPTSLPGVPEVALSGMPSTVAIAIALGGAVSFSATSLLRALAPSSTGPMMRGTRSVSTRGVRRSARALVAAELGLTIVLVSSSLVLFATVSNLMAVDLGFEPEGVMTAEVTLPESEYPDVHRATRVQRALEPLDEESPAPAFYRALLASLRALPAIAEAGVVTPLPFSGTQEGSAFWIDGMEPGSEPPIVEYTVASDGYFEAMGIERLSGRTFTTADRHDSDPVVVVSRTLAESFPNGSPVGQRLKLGRSGESPYPWMRVVGVVEDVKRTDLAEPSRGEMYVSVSQGGYTPLSTVSVILRGHPGQDRARIVDELTGAVAQLDQDVPVDVVAPMSALVSHAAAETRLVARSVLAFAVVALLVTALGLHAVVSYALAARRRELAIRAAVGAGRGEIARTVAWDALLAASTGALLGMLGLVLCQAVLDSLVFGMAPLDPRAVVGALSLLGVAGVAAIAGPLVRAGRLDLSRLLAGE